MNAAIDRLMEGMPTKMQIMKDFNSRALLSVALINVLTWGGVSAQTLAQEVTPINLQMALDRAMAEHPMIRARRADVDAAGADVDAARWQYWPTPSLTFERPNKALVQGGDKSVTTFSLKQPLWTGGRLDAFMAQTEAKREAALALREETRRDIALEVIETWGEVYSMTRRIRINEESIQTHQQFLDQIGRRAEFGLSVQSDVALANGRLEAVVADLMAARATLEAAQERLQTQIGRRVEGVELAVLAMAPLDVAEALQLAQQQDPTLMRVKAEVSELQAQLDSGKSALFPELSARIVHKHRDVSGDITQVFVGFESKWGSGLSNFSAVQAAAQRLQAKNEEMEHRSRKLIEQIRADQNQLQAARSRVRAFGEVANATQSVAQSWGRQFAAGKKSWQDVLNAVREATQAQIQLADATGLTAVIEWRLAVLTHGVDAVLQTEMKKP